MASAARFRKPWLRRFGWMVLIWVTSVTALAAVATLFKLLMGFVGLTV
jgi:hypothetical protein